ncbi:hypothetical protein KAU09_00670 [Candidatus Parcubacteria bacterium]|nr:hypothetical protein [Candidatus Parcubacteria bacterium]
MIDLLQKNKNKRNYNEIEDELELKQKGEEDGQNQENIEAKEKAPASVNLNRYKDPSGLSIKKMQIGLWLVANRKNFKLIFTIFLVLIIACFWGMYFIVFGSQVLFGIKQDKKLIQGLIVPNLVNYEALSKNFAKNLEINQPGAIATSDSKFDFYVKIRNPNDKYWVHFDYYFRVSNQNSRKENNFILPGETKYILLLGEKLETQNKNAEFVIDKIEWEKIDFHKYDNWPLFAKEHLDIKISDIEFTPAKSSALSEKININTLDFSTTNNTAYNYWNIAYNALLFKGSRIIGVNRCIVDRLMSGQTQEIGITWPEDLGNVGNIVIYPEVDITRNDIYIRFDGETGTEK